MILKLCDCLQNKHEIKREHDESLDGTDNKELKRLQFYGAGPKMAGYNVEKKEEKTRGKILHFDFDPVSFVLSTNPASFLQHIFLWHSETSPLAFTHPTFLFSFIGTYPELNFSN